MANNTKYVLGIGATGSGDTFQPPSSSLEQDGWDPMNGTQVPEGTNMNYIHRQLSLSNDFWHVVDVNLDTNTFFVIDEGQTAITSMASYPAESILFNVSARAGTVASNFINVGGAGGNFNNWPVGRSFWVRNGMADRAVFIQMPNIAANAPSIPEEITQIFKILVPGQIVKFRLTPDIDGSSTSKRPFLTMEYDSHFIGNPNLLYGVTAMNMGAITLTREVILDYFNGNSYCAFAKVVCDFPDTNLTTTATGRFLQAYNCNSSTLTLFNNSTGDNNWPHMIWPTQFQRPSGVYDGGLNMPGRWCGFNIGHIPTTDEPSHTGLVNMRLPDLANILMGRDVLPDLITQATAIQFIRPMAGGAPVAISGTGSNQQWASTFTTGGTLVGHTTTSSNLPGSIMGEANVLAIGAAIPTQIEQGAGRYIAEAYVIYPDLSTATATTPGYF